MALHLEQITKELNAKARLYKIANLQTIRKSIHGQKRTRTNAIFSNQTVKKDYAFHSGGRSEIQFNIGFEGAYFRYGIAFSLEKSRSLTDISGFEQKILKFNEYFTYYPSTFTGLKMWWWKGENRSKFEYPVSVIDTSLFEIGNFIFIGRLIEQKTYNPEDVLSLFDHLLPLYKYVESKISKNENRINTTTNSIEMKGFGKSKKTDAKVTTQAKKFDIELRHNIIQKQVCEILASKYGDSNISDECETPYGTRIDIVKKKDCRYTFYEIKTASTLKNCIREATGQLLEYSYWGNIFDISEMIIVAEHEATDEAVEYFKYLRKQFNLPIYYQQVMVENATISEKF